MACTDLTPCTPTIELPKAPPQPTRRHIRPPAPDAARIATAVETYPKAVSDATVLLANELGIFPHTTPAPVS